MTGNNLSQLILLKNKTKSDHINTLKYQIFWSMIIYKIPSSFKKNNTKGKTNFKVGLLGPLNLSSD